MELPLNVEIPLHDVTSMAIRLDRRNSQRSHGRWTQQKALSVTGGKASRYVGRRLEYHEGRRLVLLEQEVSAKRLHVVNAKAAADRGLAVLERIPGESHARLKVAERGVGVIWANAAAGGAGLRRYPIGWACVEL